MTTMTKTDTFYTDWPSLFILSINDILIQKGDISAKDEEHLITLMHNIRDHWSVLNTNAHTWATQALKTWGELMLSAQPNQNTESQWYEHLHGFQQQEQSLHEFKPHIISMLQCYQHKSIHKHSHQALTQKLQLDVPCVPHKSYKPLSIQTLFVVFTLIIILASYAILL